MEDTIDIDNVLYIMKNSFGWGDSVINRIENFENSKHHKKPKTDMEYAKQFNVYLKGVADGTIGEVETKNVEVTTYDTSDDKDMNQLSKDMKNVASDSSKSASYDDEKGEIMIKKESKVFKKKDLLENTLGFKKINLSESDIISIFERSINPVMKKSDLVETIKNKLIISEANMNDDVRRRFESGDNDYRDILNQDLVNQLAQEHFREVADNMKRRLGKDDIDFMEIQQLLGQSLLSAAREEYRLGTENLERRAIEMIRKQFNVPADAVDFEATITGIPPEMLGVPANTPQAQLDGISQSQGFKIGKINRQGLKMSKGDKQPPENKTSEELKPAIKRRRLTNAMMHGAARKSQNLHHLDDQLRQENPALGNHYANIMAANDINYFLMDDESIKQQGESGVQAGNVRLDLSNPDKPKIIAQGIVFPVLLHELAKGVVELMSLWGLSDDPEVRKYVLDKTDNLESETNDIRLGTKIWEKFVEQIPVENQEVISLTWNMLQQLPDNEFNTIIEGLLTGSTDSHQKIRRMVEEAIEEIRSEEMGDVLSDYSDDEEDEDTMTPPEDEEDDELSKLIGGQETEDDGEVDYENMSRSELEYEIDIALDAGDMELVKYLGSLLQNK